MANPKLTPKGRKLRKEWIAALESGNYRQGKGDLRARNRGGKLEYCCLGVLCNLVDSKKWKQNPDFGRSNCQNFEYEGWTDQPPKAISKLVGLTLDQVDDLMEYNDAYGLTFKQIAKVLKENKFIQPYTDEWYDFFNLPQSERDNDENAGLEDGEDED